MQHQLGSFARTRANWNNNNLTQVEEKTYTQHHHETKIILIDQSNFMLILKRVYWNLQHPILAKLLKGSSTYSQRANKGWLDDPHIVNWLWRFQLWALVYQPVPPHKLVMMIKIVILICLSFIKIVILICLSFMNISVYDDIHYEKYFYINNNINNIFLRKT
jgi:hypothetical protein